VEQLHWLLEGSDIAVVRRHSRLYEASPELYHCIGSLCEFRIVTSRCKIAGTSARAMMRMRAEGSHAQRRRDRHTGGVVRATGIKPE
jgi:hypothetical protein